MPNCVICGSFYVGQCECTPELEEEEVCHDCNCEHCQCDEDYENKRLSEEI